MDCPFLLFFVDEEMVWFQQLRAGQKFTPHSAYLTGDNAVLNDLGAGKPCKVDLFFWAMSPEEEVEKGESKFEKMNTVSC